MWSGICKQIFNVKNYRLLRKKYKQNFIYVPFRRYSSNLPEKSTNLDKYSNSLGNLVSLRQNEAKRSILVQVQSSNSYKELYAYCSVFGVVKHMFHYSSGIEQLHFILVEFSSEEDVKNVLSSSCHLEDGLGVPVNSPFLWFRVCPKKKALKLPKTNKLDLENGCCIVTNETLTEHLKKCDNISEQMEVLYKKTKLNDLGTRLRFLTARQVELAVSGMFTDAIAYPFGSSINGYGKMGCDLDLILKLDSNKYFKDSRLVYQCKELFGTERTQSQRHMEAIGDLLQLFLPGCSQIRRILQARVPILKYNQIFTGIECDLTMVNMTAFQMSELLYLFGSLDKRVCPLVFTIRKWAHEVGLTNSSPGRWITNFSLTLLVLSFLQRNYQNSTKILPSIKDLEKLVEKNSNLPHCTFLIPEKNLPQNKNQNSLETLLKKFFEFYSEFDFVTKAISLTEAADILKPEHSALYIVNPLEKGLNVSKNVSLEELDKLRSEMRDALWHLESGDKTKNLLKWGILSLFENKSKVNKIILPPPRLMDVTKLFDDNDLDQHDEKSDRISSIEFKNEHVKKQIEDIKNETKNRIDELSPVNLRNRNRKVRRR